MVSVEKPLGWLKDRAGFETHHGLGGVDAIVVSGGDIEMARGAHGCWSVEITKVGDDGNSHQLSLTLGPEVAE